MRTSLRVVTPPIVEPVSLDLVRDHARIDSDVTDSLVAMYLATARGLAETYLGRALITQTLSYTYGSSPQWGYPSFQWNQRPAPVDIPRSPTQGISSVIWRDTNDVDTALLSSQYSVDLTGEPARLRIGCGVLTGPVRHTEVVFTAGYGDIAAAVPEPIVNAILLLTTFLYEERGDAGGEIPRSFEWLLDPFRLQFFGG